MEVVVLVSAVVGPVVSSRFVGPLFALLFVLVVRCLTDSWVLGFPPLVRWLRSLMGKAATRAAGPQDCEVIVWIA